MYELIIDDEFKALLPKLTEDEFKELEDSILKEGCRDPIVVWCNTILDGHNRYQICKKNNIVFKVEEKTFEDRADAIDWIITNQLARRNLTPKQRTYLIGKRYTINKGRVGRPTGYGPTALKIAEDMKVDKITVEKAERFSKALDTIITKVENGEDVKRKILNEDLKISRGKIIAMAEQPPEIIENVLSKHVVKEKKKHDKYREIDINKKDEAIEVTCSVCKKGFVLMHYKGGTHSLIPIACYHSS